VTTQVLVINSGSSSIKYQLVDVTTGAPLAAGLVERIGAEKGRIKHTGLDGDTVTEIAVPDHEIGMTLVLDQFAQHGPRIDAANLAAIGHRVVQGGSLFSGPALVDDDVLAKIKSLVPLAPLHNPANLSGIVAAQHAFPTVPHVAVFDTAFHQTLPPEAYTYAIERKIAEAYAVRRYGFHGTSHLYVSRAVAELLGKDVAEINQIVLHLGNGASATAVRGGRSVETSMGLTPLEGLVMGTRSGDLDPAVLVHLSRAAGYTLDQLDSILNRRSGMLGMSGHTDMRDVMGAADEGDEHAKLALEVYYHRIRGYVGSYYAQLGHLDVIAFTAGVGENDARTRAGSLRGLAELGIEIDPDRNAGPKSEPTIISTDSSRVTVVVMPTNEELEIARQSATLVGAA